MSPQFQQQTLFHLFRQTATQQPLLILQLHQTCRAQGQLFLLPGGAQALISGKITKTHPLLNLFVAASFNCFLNIGTTPVALIFLLLCKIIPSVTSSDTRQDSPLHGLYYSRSETLVAHNCEQVQMLVSIILEKFF
jgi:hypothetical protein